MKVGRRPVGRLLPVAGLALIASVFLGGCYGDPPLHSVWIDNRSTDRLVLTLSYPNSNTTESYAVPPSAISMALQTFGTPPDRFRLWTAECHEISSGALVAVDSGLLVVPSGDVSVVTGQFPGHGVVEELSRAEPCPG
jgi:hypothetical protein